MVKKIYLLRHAKSDHPRGIDDEDRPLNSRGREASTKMGKYIVEQIGVPDVVLCSTAVRTTQTLQGISRYFPKEVPTHALKQLYLATPGEILREICKLDENINSVMVVGHNPGIHQLSVLLTGHSSNITIFDRIRLKFPTAALAVLDANVPWHELEPGFCTLEQFITPKDI